MSIVDAICNHLADMPGRTLPVFPMLFPLDTIECIAVFPSGAGVGGNIGIQPGHYTTNAGGIGALDYPGFQVQVRRLDPHNAFADAEAIRLWLDFNPPTGYLICSIDGSQPRDMTNSQDLAMAGGAVYRWEVSFGTCKVRA